MFYKYFYNSKTRKSKIKSKVKTTSISSKILSTAFLSVSYCNIRSQPGNHFKDFGKAFGIITFVLWPNFSKVKDNAKLEPTASPSGFLCPIIRTCFCSLKSECICCICDSFIKANIRYKANLEE